MYNIFSETCLFTSGLMNGRNGYLVMIDEEARDHHGMFRGCIENKLKAKSEK
jgi:hypothetical protein